jgi:alkanesulfonate monooxygenase SsuD/methylene tetrahydromethanopterin reductase-like flavin-dependent oxidoreductase (luciferase family)
MSSMTWWRRPAVRITSASARSGWVSAQVPAFVSDDVDAAKKFAAEQLSFYEAIPSYQKVIAREGVTSAADVAAVGSAESVRRQLQSYLDAGATDVVLSALAWADAAVGRRTMGCRRLALTDRACHFGSGAAHYSPG